MLAARVDAVKRWMQSNGGCFRVGEFPLDFTQNQFTQILSLLACPMSIKQSKSFLPTISCSLNALEMSKIMVNYLSITSSGMLESGQLRHCVWSIYLEVVRAHHGI